MRSIHKCAFQVRTRAIRLGLPSMSVPNIDAVFMKSICQLHAHCSRGLPAIKPFAEARIVDDGEP